MNSQGKSFIVLSFHMKRIVLLSIGFCLCEALFFTPAAATLQSLQTGLEAPDFSLKTVMGEKKSFSDVKGKKLTILVFWSTWSSKSEDVLARMQKLHEQYKDQGLSIIGLNADEQHVSDTTIGEIKNLSARLNLGFPMLVDQGLVAFNDYGVIALPTTVIMDSGRVIKYELPGYPLVGSETMVDFVVATIEGKRQMVREEKAGYQPNKNAQRFYNMGKAILKSKTLVDTAESWFKKAIESDPAFALPHLSLGKIYLKRGDLALAQAAFKEVLAREPGNPIALCESGMILVNEGKGGEGMALFEAAKKAEELYAPCYYYAGYAYGKEGKLEAARKMFAEAEKISPFDYHNFIYQGRVFEGNKDLQKAFEAYKKALEIILHLN